MSDRGEKKSIKAAFVYSDKFGSVQYGLTHPMKPVRLRLTRELMDACALLHPADLVEARRATEEEVSLFHTPEYVKTLKASDNGMIPPDGTTYGLGFGDNPVFKGVYEWSTYSTGASVQAAELVTSGRVQTAFNIAGGLHHAMPSRASGFCYINDPAVAIKTLVEKGKRVAYVDVDAHHGDGVEYAFYDTDRVLTISIHESGQWLFPGTGSVTDLGLGRGKGFSINLPLPPTTGDEDYASWFEELVPDFIEAFCPDVLVTQLGVDSFATDPITHLNLTTNGFEEVVKSFKSFDLPWVALGGGGYDLGNVARAWTLAWAIMTGREAPEAIPPEVREENRDIYPGELLRNGRRGFLRLKKKEAERVEKNIEFLKKEALPVVSKRGGGSSS